MNFGSNTLVNQFQWQNSHDLSETLTEKNEVKTQNTCKTTAKAENHLEKEATERQSQRDSSGCGCIHQ
jgi:hypothetical protein